MKGAFRRFAVLSASMSIVRRVREASAGKPKNTKAEFVRSLPVGLVTTVIDFGLLILLTEVFGVHYLISAGVGFLAGQTWSYVASVRWVFARFRARSHKTGFSTFLTLSGIGLFLTEILLWLAAEQFGMHYLIAKVGVSAVTSLALFFARKRFLFS